MQKDELDEVGFDWAEDMNEKNLVRLIFKVRREDEQ